MAVALMAVALSKTDCDADGGVFTSAKLFDLEFDFSSIARFDGLFSTDFLPSEMSADTLVHVGDGGGDGDGHHHHALTDSSSPGYYYPSFKLVFQKLKNRLLHHISHLNIMLGFKKNSEKIQEK